jgi:hypothetical protein
MRHFCCCWIQYWRLVWCRRQGSVVKLDYFWAASQVPQFILLLYFLEDVKHVAYRCVSAQPVYSISCSRVRQLFTQVRVTQPRTAQTSEIRILRATDCRIEPIVLKATREYRGQNFSTSSPNAPGVDFSRDWNCRWGGTEVNAAERGEVRRGVVCGARVVLVGHVTHNSQICARVFSCPVTCSLSLI